MQWDDSAYAGFSTANPWIMVNPNYTKINAKDQINREDSVFKYYQKLIKLRHESDLIVYGTLKNRLGTKFNAWLILTCYQE